MQFELLQSRIGYAFGDRAILLQALTHTSYGHEFLNELKPAKRDNERLEFLGDAVLDVVISDILLESFPTAHEGELSKLRASLVNEKTLAEVARSIALQDCIRLGKGETQTGGMNKPSILSSTFEALIAAIYLDGGFHSVYPVVRALFKPLFQLEILQTSFQDFKTELQELLQAKFRVTPSYQLLQTSGPDHAKVFEVEVRFQERILARASGNSKKEAEQNAAKSALAAIRSES